MKFGIIGAMAQETALLREKMTQEGRVMEERKQHLTFIVGKLQGHDVVLVQSGIGKVASAMATTLLVTLYEVDAIINTGSAGSLSANLHIGDVVVSTSLSYHDVDVTAFGYRLGQVPQMPASYEANDKLIAAAQKAIEGIDWHAQLGQIVSSDSFISSPDKIQEIKHHFPDALCTEMEGASIAQACHILQVPFVIIRAISDSADQDAAMTFDDFIIQAGEKSAQMVFSMLKDLPLSSVH